jgi:hypothetical protein
MSRERKSAALFLLGENANSDELEDVLDFFESPIGSKISTGCIDAEQIASRIVFSIPPFFPVDYNVRACYGAWTVIDGNQS